MPARPDGRPPKRPLAADNALDLSDPDRPARWLPRPCLRPAARQHRDVARMVPPHGHQARCGYRRCHLWVTGSVCGAPGESADDDEDEGERRSTAALEGDHFLELGVGADIVKADLIIHDTHPGPV